MRERLATSGRIVLVTPTRREAGGRRSARGEALDLRGARRGDRLLVTLGPGSPSLAVGAILAVRGRLRPAASATAPEWWRRALAREGIAGRFDGTVETVVGRRGGLAGGRDQWREWMRERVARGLEGDARALVRGMAIGAVDELSDVEAERLRASGLWHLVAVSGQNVMVVAIAVLALFGLCGVGPRAATGLAIGAVILYCLACDGGASVARAGVMGVVGLLSTIVGAGRRRWHALTLGLLALLAWSPAAITDPGLQLSFAATAGLLAMSGPIAELISGWVPSRLALALGQALAAGLATAPVLVWNFGEVSPVGILAGLVAVPIAGPIVVLALAGVVSGALLPVAGVLAAGIAGLGAEVILAVAAVAAAVPGAGLRLPSSSAIALTVLAVAPRVATWWLARPAWPRKAATRRRWVVTSVVSSAGALVAVALSSPSPPAWPPRPAVTALDVGQGDAILLTDPGGAAVLVDTGPGGEEPAVMAALRRNAVRRLDVLALTHDQSDHTGGAAAVLEQLPVGLLVVPPLPAEGGPGAASALIETARRRGIPVARPVIGATITAGAWRIAVVRPESPPASGADANGSGLVVLARAGGLAVLLTADVEGGVLLRSRLPRIDVLKVAHHGSADEELEQVLRRTRPTVALISSGPNTYGHPSPSTLGALSAAGVLVRRTDTSGDVTVSETADGSLTVADGR